MKKDTDEEEDTIVKFKKKVETLKIPHNFDKSLPANQDENVVEFIIELE